VEGIPETQFASAMNVIQMKLTKLIHNVKNILSYADDSIPINRECDSNENDLQCKKHDSPRIPTSAEI
jgi:hypothetical protein